LQQSRAIDIDQFAVIPLRISSSRLLVQAASCGPSDFALVRYFWHVVVGTLSPLTSIPLHHTSTYPLHIRQTPLLKTSLFSLHKHLLLPFTTWSRGSFLIVPPQVVLSSLLSSIPLSGGSIFASSLPYPTGTSLLIPLQLLDDSALYSIPSTESPHIGSSLS
jgi:hypothetical protein